MNPREKKLVTAIAALAALGITVKVVYPRWIAPMLDYDTRITARQSKLATFQPGLKRLHESFEKFQEYTARTGHSEPSRVKDDFSRTLNEKLILCDLRVQNVSPKDESVDKKTGLVTLGYSFNTEGRLRDAVLFLKHYYELPYVTRFRDLKMVPVKGRGTDPNDTVKLTGTIEVIVPPRPDQPVPERTLEPEEVVALRPPRYRPEDLELIAMRDPFNPPKVEEPPEPVVVDTTTPEPVHIPQPPPPRSDPRDNDGANKMVRMCMQTPSEEVLVVNVASKQREFIAKGKEMDGGKLLMVHPLGALVRRMEGGQDHHFLYPIGESLTGAVRIDQAQRFPELRAFARHFLREERKKQQAAEAAQQQAAREQAARGQAAMPESPDAAAAFMNSDLFVGPPDKLAAGAQDAPVPMPQPGDAGPDLMGPPDGLMDDGLALPDDDATKPGAAPYSRPPSWEMVGPPLDLAGPAPRERRDRDERKTLNRRRLRRPQNVD